MTPLADANLHPFLAAWSACVGAVVGSFLNVVVARLPRGESLVRPRSRCPRCEAPIAWYDNVPVLSWLVLRGRCRRCRAPISLRYPLVELLGAAAGWAAFQRHGLTAPAAAEFAIVAMLLALAFIDLDTWLLPHALTWPVIGAGLAFGAAGLTEARGWSDAALGAALGFALFAGVSFVGRLLAKREALGFGDVWLLAGLGAWLGVRALLPIVLLASLQGSIVGGVLLALGRGQPGPAPEAEANASSKASKDGEDDWVPPRNAVPFGPFLVAGALEWLYLGGLFATWYSPLSFFR